MHFYNLDENLFKDEKTYLDLPSLGDYLEYQVFFMKIFEVFLKGILDLTKMHLNFENMFLGFKEFVGEWLYPKTHSNLHLFQVEHMWMSM